MESALAQPQEDGNRTGFHVAIALMATALLIGGLFVAPIASRAIKDKQMRLIQIGAKADLQLMFEKERDFFTTHGFYTTDLKALGIAPKKVLYKFGFTRPSLTSTAQAAAVPGLDSSRKDLDALKATVPELKIDYSPVTRLAEINMTQLESFCVDCTASVGAFKAIAVANLDRDEDLDIWVVTEKGDFTHLNNDLANQTQATP